MRKGSKITKKRIEIFIKNPQKKEAAIRQPLNKILLNNFMLKQYKDLYLLL